MVFFRLAFKPINLLPVVSNDPLSGESFHTVGAAWFSVYRDGYLYLYVYIQAKTRFSYIMY